MASSKNGGRSSASDSPRSSEFTLRILVRDDERPLKFYGTVLAEIESRATSVTHRGAIYRTRKGRYVSEFSSRPNVEDERLGRPSIEVVEQMRSDLLTNIRVHADSHDKQADQDTESDSHAHSADALRNIMPVLRGISFDRPEWLQLWKTYQRHDTTAASDAEKSFIRSYGYSEVGREDADVSRGLSFLTELTAAIEYSASVSEGARGNAKDFDSLAEAKSWFRPGRLTNELLRQLGDWDPEFIE